MGTTVEQLQLPGQTHYDIIMGELEEYRGETKTQKELSKQISDLSEDILGLYEIADDYGLMRTLGYILGAYISGQYIEPHILQQFGITKFDPDTGVGIKYPTELSKALTWGSRWAIAQPAYEIQQKALYPEREYLFSTPSQPIYWKQEFWGTFKKHGLRS